MIPTILSESPDVIEHWLRPSALDGAWLLLMQRNDSPPGSTKDAVRLLRSTYFGCGFDFDAATDILCTMSEQGTPDTQAAFFRSVFFQAMQSGRPAALMLLTRGREAFCNSLGLDAAECFRRCEALEDTPHTEVVRWLDALAELARHEVNEHLTELGRIAERRTMQYEVERIAGLGFEYVPTWVALNDNTAGYDVGSWDLKDGKVERRLIEVKSCGASCPEFILTRNEVRVARREPHRYIVHIWRQTQTDPLELRWLEIEPFIPEDTLRGSWRDVVIRWPQWGSKSAGPGDL